MDFVVPMAVLHPQGPKKICNICEGHLTSINFPPRNWEGYHAYLSGLGGKLGLLVHVRTIPLLRSRHKYPPIHKPGDLHRFGS